MNTDELIRLGARARIVELEQELAELRKLVGGGARRRGRPTKNAAGAAEIEAAPVVRRRKSHMSAAMRKAQSERMKAYWAARRKGKGKAAARAKRQ